MEAAEFFQSADSPLVAAAIHNGHAVRPEALGLMAVCEADRLREEDPFTGEWTTIAPTRIVGLRSRFELDLNRPRPKAVYLRPEDAWGLNLWKGPPPQALIDGSLAAYDAFYARVGEVLDGLTRRFARVVVFDLHSYNHRREGPDGPAADPEQNPEVIVGTGSMDRRRWGPVVDAFMEAIGSFDYFGRRLDVRENVKFEGGHFAEWIHGRYPESVCAPAIELKKFFMDEWTGQLDHRQHAAIGRALESAAQRVLAEL